MRDLSGIDIELDEYYLGYILNYLDIKLLLYNDSFLYLQFLQ